MGLACILLLFYLVGAVLAPVFQEAGLTFHAKLLYVLYSTTCHQFAYRSWFVYGPQVIYPLERAGIPNTLTYEKISGNDPADLDAARAFIGNTDVGFKLALCQRDVAVFLGLLFTAFLFQITGRRWVPINLLFWFVLGIIPIALDGFSQYLGLIVLFPLRESTPLLRTFTGFLFGATTACYLFPLLEKVLKMIRHNYGCEER